jgi:hypothetical protein
MLNHEADLVDELLGQKNHPEDSDLQVRLVRHYDQFKNSWNPTLTFSRKPLDSSNVHVLSRARFSKLRLYHFLDLIRLLIESLPTSESNLVFMSAAFDILTPLASHSHAGELTSTLSPHIRLASISSTFYRRWCSSKPPSGGHVAHGLNPNLKTIRRLPQVRALLSLFLHISTRNLLCFQGGGPLFYFEPTDSFRFRLQDTGSLEYQFRAFCDYILRTNPPETQARITRAMYYQCRRGFRHEFVILRAELGGGKSRYVFFLRLDRFGLFDSDTQSSSSRLTPEDKVWTYDYVSCCDCLTPGFRSGSLKMRCRS